ncbi:hypothetical protein BGZ72_005357 [Mortierella alpina]|nr:hypothetical protein BGZ72_005357 [Mortierella alpina]
MTITKFTLTVKSTSSEDERLMIILNPNLIMSTGKNYENYFPVAWKVMMFPGNSSDVSEPIEIKYKSSWSAVLHGVSTRESKKAGSFGLVKERGTVFDIVVKNELARLVESKARNPDFAAVVNNVDQQNSYSIGLGDDQGSSYLTTEIQAHTEVAFKYTPEFAIVSVSGTEVVGTKIKNGSTLKPWFTFTLDDLTSTTPTVTYDGEKIIEELDIKTTHHKSNEVVFDGGAGTSSSNAQGLPKEL